MSLDEMREALEEDRSRMGTLARTSGRRIEASKRRSVWCGCGCGERLPERNEPGQPLRYVNKYHRFRAGNARAWARNKGRTT